MEVKAMFCPQCKTKTRVLTVVALANETLRRVICPACKWLGATREAWDLAAQVVVEKAEQQQAQKPLRASNDPGYQDYCQWYDRAYQGADRKSIQKLIYEAWAGQHASVNPTSISYTRWRRETGNGC
jgi:hypothetical protein